MNTVEEINAIYRFFNDFIDGGINVLFDLRNKAVQEKANKKVVFPPKKFLGGFIKISYEYNYLVIQKKKIMLKKGEKVLPHNNLPPFEGRDAFINR